MAKLIKICFGILTMALAFIASIFNAFTLPKQGTVRVSQPAEHESRNNSISAHRTSIMVALWLTGSRCNTANIVECFCAQTIRLTGDSPTKTLHAESVLRLYRLAHHLTFTEQEFEEATTLLDEALELFTVPVLLFEIATTGPEQQVAASMDLHFCIQRFHQHVAMYTLLSPIAIESDADANADYYATLNIAPWAWQSDIKLARDELARYWHPDKQVLQDSALAVSKMIEINQAYDVLRDKQRRNDYDKAMLKLWDRHNGASGCRVLSWSTSGRLLFRRL